MIRKYAGKWLHRLLCLLLLLAGTCSLHLNATHTLGYFVYRDTVYQQGPWYGYDSVARYDGQFLIATYYEDLFGSVEEDRAEMYLYRLRQLKPGSFAWNYSLSYTHDTLHIHIDADALPLPVELSALAATFLKNGFGNTMLHLKKTPVKLLSDADITFPIFDLNMPVTLSGEKTIASDENLAQQVEISLHTPQWIYLLLVFSILMNIIFFWKRRYPRSGK